jgi:hypothetical protein
MKSDGSVLWSKVDMTLPDMISTVVLLDETEIPKEIWPQVLFVRFTIKASLHFCNHEGSSILNYSCLSEE